MTCMDIPAAYFNEDCFENANCANMLGEHTLGECRNGVCGTLPAVAENVHCDYSYECDEGLECNGGTCVPIPVPLNGECTMTTDCESGITCYEGFCLSIPSTYPGDSCSVSV